MKLKNKIYVIFLLFLFNNAVATPTGLSMSTTLGTPAVYGRQEVDDSVTSSWTNVDDSATMDWKDAA